MKASRRACRSLTLSLYWKSICCSLVCLQALAAEIAAVDVERRAGGVAGGIGRQVKDGAGHFGRFGDAMHRYAGQRLFEDDRVVEQRRRELGVGRAWQQRIDAHL